MPAFWRLDANRGVLPLAAEAALVRRSKHFFNGLLVALLFPLASGCASPWKKTSIELPPEARAERVFVYREQLVVEGVPRALGYDHPATISPTDLARLFRNLAYRPSRLWEEAIDELVFPEDTSDELARAIAFGLEQIDADERLRFLATDDTFSNLFVGTTGSSGVVFRTADGTLHLAFDRIHQGVNDGHGGRPEDVIFADDPTELTDGSPLVALPGTRRHVVGATDHPRWLEVDIAALARLPESPRTMSESELAGRVRPDGRTHALRADGKLETPASTASANTATLAPSAASEAGTRAAPVTSTSSGGPAAADTPAAGAPAADTPAEDPDYETVRRQIERLKRLLDDGAISQADYEREFSRILGDPEPGP